MPQQPTYTLRNFRVICNVVLGGTYLVIAAAVILLLLSFSMNQSQPFGRLLVCGLAFAYMVTVHMLIRLNYHRLVAYMLTAFYTVLASGILWHWGIDTPIGTLILGLVIVLAGILLTARHSLFAAIAAGSILAGIHTTTMLGWHTPDTSWSANESNFGDVLAYCTVFGMLALISWLYNREMERSLAHAQRAEAALLQQKATLKLQVKKRTAQLRRSQLEEMRQMYRFAELGQLGVALLHDLANYLTALTLEIDGMHSTQHAKALARARRIIRYLDGVIDNTRKRLHGDTQEHVFDIIQQINEVVSFLHFKAKKSHVAIDWQPPAQPLKYTGDSTSFSQIIAIITNNAIDAYDSPEKTALTTARHITLTAQQTKTHIIIRISDQGKGISSRKRKELFKPYHSTKKTGLGLGLYIAKQTVEMQFLGTMALSNRRDRTEFIITLPR